MKRVILTIGPQYAGKSTFCEKVVAAFPDVVLASRDKILLRLYGTIWLSNYSGGHDTAWHELWKEVDGYLSQLFSPTIILDAWNGPPEDRKSIVQKLKERGVTRVDGWHFVTPLKTCIEWSFLREPLEMKNKWSELRREIRVDTYTSIHRAFCQTLIESEGLFDSVRRINALEAVPRDILAVSS